MRPDGFHIKEKQITDIAQTLQLDIPTGQLPVIIRLIMLFTLIGGLSIIGSLFVDIGRPSASVLVEFYLLRLTIGLIAITAAYCITKKKRWAMWLYALIAVIGVWLNPITAIIPGAVTVYLYTQRQQLTPSPLDIFVRNMRKKIKLRFR